MRRLLILAPVLAVVLSGCGGTDASDEELFVVCQSIGMSGRYGQSPSTGVGIAHNVLTKDYGRSGEEAADIIDEAVRTECPEFRSVIG